MILLLLPDFYHWGVQVSNWVYKDVAVIIHNVNWDKDQINYIDNEIKYDVALLPFLI